MVLFGEFSDGEHAADSVSVLFIIINANDDESADKLKHQPVVFQVQMNK